MRISFVWQCIKNPHQPLGQPERCAYSAALVRGVLCAVGPDNNIKIDNNAQVEPALMRANIRYVGYPRVIRFRRVELTSQCIGSNDMHFT